MNNKIASLITTICKSAIHFFIFHFFFFFHYVIIFHYLVLLFISRGVFRKYFRSFFSDISFAKQTSLCKTNKFLLFYNSVWPDWVTHILVYLPIPINSSKVISHINRRYISCYIFSHAQHKICRSMGFLWTIFSQIPVQDCLQYEDEIIMITK